MAYVEEVEVEDKGLSTRAPRGARVRVVVCGVGSRTSVTRLLEERPGLELSAVPEADDLRALVPAAVTAEVAVVVVDAAEGLGNRTRRGCYVCRLLGVRHLIFAVTGLGLVEDAPTRYVGIEAEVEAFAAELGGQGGVQCIPLPISPSGDLIDEPLRWYQGADLATALDEVRHAVRERVPFRFHVGGAPNSGIGGAAGSVVSGIVRPGDSLVVLPAGTRARVQSVRGADGELREAGVGQSISLALEGSPRVEPGDLIASASSPAQVSDHFRCTIVWLSEEPLFPGRPYLMRINGRTVGVSVTEPRYKVDPETFAHLAVKKLDVNDVGACNIQTDQPVAFDPHVDNRETGRFTLLDRQTERLVGVGTLGFALWRSQNVHWQTLDVSKHVRSDLKGQKPCVIWFTGLSGSGKSTIANLLEKRLVLSGRHTYLLDGDNVRHGLNKDLGFTDADRIENIRRVTEVSKLMVDAGLIVLVSFISPFRAERRMARDTLGEGEFIEVFVDTPLAEAERRDPKGLYKKARAGRLKHFTGIDSPYEPPDAPDVHVRTLEHTPEEAVDVLLSALRRAGKLDPNSLPAT